jgi:hypothetical protein
METPKIIELTGLDSSPKKLYKVFKDLRADKVQLRVNGKVYRNAGRPPSGRQLVSGQILAIYWVDIEGATISVIRVRHIFAGIERQEYSSARALMRAMDKAQTLAAVNQNPRGAYGICLVGDNLAWKLGDNPAEREDDTTILSGGRWQTGALCLPVRFAQLEEVSQEGD